MKKSYFELISINLRPLILITRDDKIIPLLPMSRRMNPLLAGIIPILALILNTLIRRKGLPGVVVVIITAVVPLKTK